jgi:type I restriction enzyme R subunit
MFPEIFRRRRLPHWDVPGAIYFVTMCLDGSIPAQGLLALQRYREQLGRRPILAGLTPQEWKIRQWKTAFARSDDWLDHRPAVRHLADPRLAVEVVNAIYHFLAVRYDVFGYVVMPSHVHWVFQPLDKWVREIVGQAAGLPDSRQASGLPHFRPPRERILHTLKTHTALECNRLLGQQGSFWQDESYDHCVFDVDELERILHYVENNPVCAGLATRPEDWPYSSARDRNLLNLPFGHPLPRRT